jgi:hypothetical protein
MKKIIPIIAIVLLAMTTCHHSKIVTEGEKDVAIVIKDIKYSHDE